APLVSRELRFGVAERIAPDGSVITRLEQSGVDLVAKQIAELGAESIAVCLLFSFANPEHEQLIASSLKGLGLPFTLSHRILPDYLYYERTSTTVINSYLVPMISRYLRALGSGLKGLSVPAGPSQPHRTQAKIKKVSAPSKTLIRVMQSNGGSVSAEIAAG